MRHFAQKGFLIEHLSIEAKIIYTAFQVFSLAALAVSITYYSTLVDDAPLVGARVYYAGEVPAPAPPPQVQSDPYYVATPGDGPELVIPDEVESDEAAARLIAPMTTRKLLEVTHFHLFTVPVFLLIIAHLFILCGMSPRAKRGWILSAVSSTALHMAAPWVVFEGGGGWAWLTPVSGVWMSASMIVLIVWPLWSMWSKPRE